MACRDHGPNDLFPLGAATGRPADRGLRLFYGRTVGEVLAVVARLRSEVADELARTRARRSSFVSCAKAALADTARNSDRPAHPAPCVCDDESRTWATESMMDDLAPSLAPER